MKEKIYITGTNDYVIPSFFSDDFTYLMKIHVQRKE